MPLCARTPDHAAVRAVLPMMGRCDRADDSALRMSHDVCVIDGAREYGEDERRQQLGQLARLCSAMSELLRSHGEVWTASLFVERAELANRLLAEGWDRTSLTDVSAQFPAGPDWLNPKAVDFGAPRNAWQDKVAALHARASRLALELRAVATHD